MFVNEKYINESEVKESCEVNTKEQPCQDTPSVRYYLKTELKNPWITVKGVNLKTNKTVMEQTFNLCVVDKLPMINVFMSLFFEMFKMNINFELKCPFKPVSLVNLVNFSMK